MLCSHGGAVGRGSSAPQDQEALALTGGLKVTTSHWALIYETCILHTQTCTHVRKAHCTAVAFRSETE